MLQTAGQVASLALVRVGHSRPIDSLDEASTEAQLCKALFGHCRDEVLSSHMWPFATRRADLAQLTETRDGWEYTYALPSDCLRPRRLVLDTTSAARVPFEIEASADGTRPVLLTNQETATLLYTRTAPAVGIWPSLFVSAVAWRLAAELANGLKKDPKLAANCLQFYQATLAQAGADAANTGVPEDEPTTPSIAARS